MEVENNDEGRNYVEIEVSPSAPPMRLLNMLEIPSLTDAAPEDEIEFLSKMAQLYRQQKTIRDKCCTVLQLRLWFNNFGTNRGVGMIATLAMELSLESCFPHGEDPMYPTWGKIVIEEAASRMSKNPRDLAHIFAQMLPQILAVLQSAANQIIRDPGNTYRIIRTYASTLDLDANYYYDCFVQTMVRVCMTLFPAQSVSAFNCFQRCIESFFADAMEDQAVGSFPITGTTVKRLVSNFFEEEFYKFYVALLETGNVQNGLVVSMNSYVKTICGVEWYHVVIPKMEVLLLAIMQIIGRENPTKTGHVLEGLAILKKVADVVQRAAAAESGGSGGGRTRPPRYGSDQEVAKSLLGERFLPCLQMINNFLISSFEAPRQQKTDILNALTFFMQNLQTEVGLHIYKVLMTLQIATFFYLELPNDLRLANAMSDAWTEYIKILKSVNKIKELGTQIVASMINILQLGGVEEVFARPVDLLIVRTDKMSILKELAFLPNMSVFGPAFNAAEQRLFSYRMQLSALCNNSRRKTPEVITAGNRRADQALALTQRGVEENEFASVLFRINQLLNATETATSGMTPMEARNPSRASQLSPSRVTFKVTGPDLRRMLLERLAIILASCQDDIVDILTSRDAATPHTQETSGFRHIYDTLITLLYIMHGVESRDAVLVGMCLGWLGAVDPAKFALALPKDIEPAEPTESTTKTLITSVTANKIATNPASCSGADEPEFFAQILVRTLTSSYLGSTGSAQQDAACFAIQEVLKLYSYQTAEVSKTIPEEFREVLFPFISTHYTLLDDSCADHPFVRAINNVARASSSANSSGGRSYTPVYEQTSVSTYSRWIRQWACYLVQVFKPADANSPRTLPMKLFSKCLRALMLEDTRFCTNLMPWLLLHIVGDEAAPLTTSVHDVSISGPSHEVPLGPNARNVLTEFQTVLRSRIAPTASQHVGNCIAQEAIMFVCNVLDFFRQYCRAHKPRSSASGDGRSNATGEVRSRVTRIGSFVNRISDQLLWEASFYTGSYARSLQFFENNLSIKCRRLEVGWPSTSPLLEQQQQATEEVQQQSAPVYKFTETDREFFKSVYMRMGETDGIQGTLRLSVCQLRRDDEMILHRIAGKLDEGLVTLVSSYRGSRATASSSVGVTNTSRSLAGGPVAVDAAILAMAAAAPLRSIALTTNMDAAEAANVAAKSASAANDMDTLIPLLDCMIELEQFESALHWADSTNRERRQSHEQDLLDKQYECLAMLGEWDKLSDLAEAHPADDLASILDGFARVYLAAKRGEALRFYHDVEQLRQFLVQRVRSDKCDSEPYYTRYENMIMLHSLQDVDVIGSYLFGFAAQLPMDMQRQRESRRTIRVFEEGMAEAMEVVGAEEEDASDVESFDEEEDDEVIKLQVPDASDAYFLQLPAAEKNNPVEVSAETHRQQFMLSGSKIKSLADLDRILNQRSELITPSYDNLRLLMAPRRIMLSLAQSLASKDKLKPFEMPAAGASRLPGASSTIVGGQQPRQGMVAAIQQSLSSCLLRLCKTARKASRQTNAYHLLINAENVCGGKDGTGICDIACACESAKWQWQNNMRETALNTLNQLNRQTLSLRMLPPAEKERRDACHFDMLDDATRQAAKISLLCARYNEELGYYDYNETRSMYAEVGRVFPQWHKAHYHVGRYQDARLLTFSESSDPYGVADANASSSSGQLGTLTNSSLSDRMQDVYSVVESYLLSLRYGIRYIDRILPRLLTLFMDYGEEIEDRCQHARAPKGTAKTAGKLDQHLAEAEVKMQELCKLIIEFAVKHLPVYVFYPAIQQLASRLSHPSANVYRVICTILSRCFFFYPSQTVWYLISSYTIGDDARKQKASGMYNFFLAEARVAASLPFSAAALELFHKNFMLFITILLKFITHETNQKKISARSIDSAKYTEFCTLLRKFNDSDIPVVLPCSDAMLPIMPAKRTPSDKEHIAFPLQDHYRMEKMEEEISVFSSMARPKRASIVCRGGQGRKYGLMLKPKDDLRKDGRFLEVIHLLKKLLLQNDESRKRQLTMRSYMALPITENSGVLEFVENLAPLGELVNDMIKHRNLPNNRHKTAHNVPPLTKGSRIEGQLPLLLKYFVEVAVPQNPSVFYDWFGVRFADPVAWYEARTAFTRTYAVAAMATYIMGIGDRHLENIMVDTTTGEVFNVDFECLFHKGETLPVAEVVPFRLTHNVVGAFGPLQCEGPFRIACEITLRIMQEEKDSVLNRCRSFLWDPLVEWKQQNKVDTKSSRRKTAANANVSSDDRFNFVARIVYAVIEKKLSGYVRKFNPHETGGRMGLMSKIPLSVEGQVDAVIRDARDPRNLCRMFSGWSAFV